MVTLKINGETREIEVASDTPLLWALRDELNLTGTKFGCGMALCGACTVHVDGVATRACVTPVASLAGRAITTIEGATDPLAEAVKQAWVALDVAQCGYCQPGQVMAAVALLRRVPQPTDEQVDRALAGNLCRCGAYPRIRAAVQRAASLWGTG
jgi:isoquinoline 1-oxidoreductase alpha subunit